MDSSGSSSMYYRGYVESFDRGASIVDSPGCILLRVHNNRFGYAMACFMGGVVGRVTWNITNCDIPHPGIILGQLGVSLIFN